MIAFATKVSTSTTLKSLNAIIFILKHKFGVFMPDEFSKDTVYIISKSARRYDVLQTQNGVIFKKRPTPCVYPEYKKPRPISHSKPKPENKVISIPDLPKKDAQQSPPVNPVHSAPISNSSSFEDLQKKVAELRKKEEEKRELQNPNPVVEDTSDVPVVTMEDADDLANGIVAEEQELINREYLKSLTFGTLKKVYYVATGKQFQKGISKFEMRKDIIDAYKEATAERKKIIYESSRA